MPGSTVTLCIEHTDHVLACHYIVISAAARTKMVQLFTLV